MTAIQNSFMIPITNVSKKIISRFKVINNTNEPDSLYFFPGFHFSNVLLYKIENNKAIQLPVIAPKIEDSISFRLFNISPNDTLSILAECYPLRTYNNTFKPRLINPEYIAPFVLELQLQKKNVTLFTYIFCGLLLMMILFSLANFLQGGAGNFFTMRGMLFFSASCFLQNNFIIANLMKEIFSSSLIWILYCKVLASGFFCFLW